MEMKSLQLFGHTFAECFTLDRDFRLPREMNNDACLAYIQQGTQEVYSPTQKIIAQDKESILMKCGNYLANFRNITPTNHFKSIVFHLDPTSIKKAFGDKDLSFLNVKRSAKPINPALKLGQNTLLDSFVNSLLPYFDNPDLVNENLLAIKLQELVLILSNGENNVLANQILGTLYSPEQLKFEEVISSNLYNNLSIKELAHLSAKSESTFERDFSKFFKQSPAKYFRIRKLEKAAELLEQTELPITEIAWECGFENAAHFSTVFTKQYGKSPKSYRYDLN